VTEPFDRNSYETPQWLFDEYNRQMNFTWDLAATPENTKCEKFMTADIDSLGQSWDFVVGWAWLNPPYKPLKPWIEKCQAECALGTKIVALVPLPTITTLYFNPELVYRMDIVQGRISFERHGVPQHGNDSTHCLLFFDRDRNRPDTINMVTNFVDSKKLELKWRML